MVYYGFCWFIEFIFLLVGIPGSFKCVSILVLSEKEKEIHLFWWDAVALFRLEND